MPHPTLFRSVSLALCLAVTLLASAGCESGFRIGSWQVIDPDEPLSITRVELTRTQTAGDGKTLVINQQLTIDLSNGRAAFTDTDGEVYPQQVDAKVVAQLRTQLADLDIKEADLDAADKSPLLYTVKAYDTESTVKRHGSWKSPSPKPLVPVLQTLSDTFDQAFRGAHPLSKDIDLTK
jgi:hypothetical protein